MDNPIYSTRKRTQRDYSLGFKLSVVELVEKGDLTYKQAQRRYGIQGRSTVLVWLRKHGKLDWTSPHHLPMNPMKETPAQIIKRLEKELEDERLRTQVLEGMVDQMDKATGGKLRKKRLANELDSSSKKKT